MVGRPAEGAGLLDCRRQLGRQQLIAGVAGMKFAVFQATGEEASGAHVQECPAGQQERWIGLGWNGMTGSVGRKEYLISVSRSAC